MTKLFAPQATVKVSATNSASTGQALPGTRGQAGPFQIRVLNDGTTVAHIKFGSDTTVAAATTDLPIAPNSLPQGFTIANPSRGDQLFFSVIMDSSTANVYVTVGDGI
jgi:hypothetical protein